jgi:hypothetical protein
MEPLLLLTAVDLWRFRGWYLQGRLVLSRRLETNFFGLSPSLSRPRALSWVNWQSQEPLARGSQHPSCLLSAEIISPSNLLTKRPRTRLVIVSVTAENSPAHYPDWGSATPLTQDLCE